jgi:hypothetical protein
MAIAIEGHHNSDHNKFVRHVSRSGFGLGLLTVIDDQCSMHNVQPPIVTLHCWDVAAADFSLVTGQSEYSSIHSCSTVYEQPAAAVDTVITVCIEGACSIDLHLPYRTSLSAGPPLLSRSVVLSCFSLTTYNNINITKCCPTREMQRGQPARINRAQRTSAGMIPIRHDHVSNWK